MTMETTTDRVAKWTASSILGAGLLGLLAVCGVVVARQWVGWSLVDRGVFGSALLLFVADLTAWPRPKYRYSVLHDIVGVLWVILGSWPFNHDPAVLVGVAIAFGLNRAFQRFARQRGGGAKQAAEQ